MKKVKYFLVGVALLLLVVVLFFFWASSPRLQEKAYATITKYKAHGNPNDSVFSIVTYNIGYLSGMTNNLPMDRTLDFYNNNLALVKNAFSIVKPDIIAFQEIDFKSKRSFNRNQQKELSALGYAYGAEVINWDEHYVPFPYFPITQHFGAMLSGQSILSKYPIANQERIVLERVQDSPFWRDAFYLDRLLQVVTLIINNKEVKVLNVHLEAFDKGTRARQTQKVIEVYKKYASTYPTILLGDFNSDIHDKQATITKLLATKGLKVASVNGKSFPSDHPEKLIDYIFYNEAFIDVVDAAIINEVKTASDHLPVLMKFKFK